MAENEERLLLRIEASLRGYERTMAKMKADTNRAAGRVERRFGDMSRTMDRHFAAMTRSATTFAGAFGLALGGSELARLTAGALQAAESINDMAARANVSAEFLQELRFAADQNGASARDFDDAISRLNRRLGLFLQSGGGPAAEAFRELGLQTRIASGELSTAEAVFDAAVLSLEGVESAARRSALASQLFGEDSGPRLAQMLALGSSGLEQFRQRARDAGIVMEDELVRNGAAANAEIRAMRQEISGQFNRAVVENADQLRLLAKALGAVASAAISATGALVDMFTNPEGSEAITEEIQRLETRLRNLRAGGGRVEQIDDLEQRLNDLRGQLTLALDFEEFQRWWESQAVDPESQDPPPPSSLRGDAAEPLPAPVQVGVRPGTAGGVGGLMPSDSDIEKVTTIFAEQLGEKVPGEIGDALTEQRQRIASGLEAGIRAAAEGNAIDFFVNNLRNAVYSALSDALANAMPMGGKKGGFFNQFVSTLFGVASGKPGGTGGGKLPMGGKRAGGGGVSPNYAYTVGERGPETFVPHTAGMIVPGQTGGRRSVMIVNNAFTLRAEGAVMTDDLLAEMDRKAAVAESSAVARSAAGLKNMQTRQMKRLS